MERSDQSSRPFDEDGEYELHSLRHVAEPTLGLQLPGGAIIKTHAAAICEGEACTIHNPSEHHMRDWPLNWRGDRMLMERLCPHGVGHPDPDDLAYHERNGRAWQGIHGCDGCCTP